MKQYHTIEPFFGSDSEILILGSFPSVKSREVGFYYGHPQNRFWRVLAAVFEDNVPEDNDAKKDFLRRHKVALWDVIACCDIDGSADSSIKNAVPNDISLILSACPIKGIFTNGKTADRLYRTYNSAPCLCLPSTSPANAAKSLEKLTDEWKIIKQTV